MWSAVAGHSSETSPLLGRPDGRSILKSDGKSDSWMLIVAQPPELGVAGSLPGRGATRHAEPRSGDGNPAWVTILRGRGRSFRFLCYWIRVFRDGLPRDPGGWHAAGTPHCDYPLRQGACRPEGCSCSPSAPESVHLVVDGGGSVTRPPSLPALLRLPRPRPNVAWPRHPTVGTLLDGQP